MASECANEQGKFWEYHDKLFVKWLGENVGMYSIPQLEKFADSLKLNTAKFNECLETSKYASVVKSEYDEALKLGARGTPTFYINGKALQVNSLEFSDFARAIDALLK